MRDDSLFDWATHQIQRSYDELGYELGWRFLFTPRSTLRRGCDFVVVGLNPAGGEHIASTGSIEEGNAFRPGIGRPIASPSYARRLCEMFQALAAELREPWEELMDRTPTSNFCPFRAPNGLPDERRDEAVAFSRRLWRRILTGLEPRALLTLGQRATREFEGIARSAGGIPVVPMPHPSSRVSNRDRLRAVRSGTERLVGLLT